MMILGGFFTLLGETQPARPGGGNFFMTITFFVLIFMVFYFLVIMPSRKKQKKHQEMVEQLKPGDKVVTSGGIYGTVMGVQKDRIELKIASNVKIDITKNAVGTILATRKKSK